YDKRNQNNNFVKMSKLVLNEDARGQLLAGIRQLYLAVSGTLGPDGKFALIARENKKIHVTKDGATVAKEVKLPDPIEMMGAQMIREAAEKTAARAGDGTTTSIILAYKFIEEALSLVHSGSRWESGISMWEGCVEKTVRFFKKSGNGY